MMMELVVIILAIMLFITISLWSSKVRNARSKEQKFQRVVQEYQLAKTLLHMHPYSPGLRSDFINCGRDFYGLFKKELDLHDEMLITDEMATIVNSAKTRETAS
jgi:hypothetical protein